MFLFTISLIDLVPIDQLNRPSGRFFCGYLARYSGLGQN